MDELLLKHEPLLRLATFLVVLAVMAAAEVVSPRRRREIPRVLRWTNNLALVVLDTAILRLLFPVLAVGMAFWRASTVSACSTCWPSRVGSRSWPRS